MARYWVIAPFNAGHPDVLEAIWNFDYENGLISIGWRDVGDVSSLGIEEIRERVQSLWPDQKPRATAHDAHQLYKFYHVIQPGDIIVARWGTKRIAGIGHVKSKAYFDSEKLRNVFREFGAKFEEILFPNHIDVEWHYDWSGYEYPAQVFGIQTLQELTEERYLELTAEDDVEASVDEKVVEEGSNITGVDILERYLEGFIVSNFDSIFQGNLEIYSCSEEGHIGQQYRTDVGVIDILSQDSDTGDFVVIELKRGRAADKVVGQILKYMGWVLENLCEDGQSVRGLIICSGSDQKLDYAIKMVNTVSVKYYRMDFQLQDTPPNNVIST